MTSNEYLYLSEECVEIDESDEEKAMNSSTWTLEDLGFLPCSAFLTVEDDKSQGPLEALVDQWITALHSPSESWTKWGTVVR